MGGKFCVLDRFGQIGDSKSMLTTSALKIRLLAPRLRDETVRLAIRPEFGPDMVFVCRDGWKRQGPRGD